MNRQTPRRRAHTRAVFAAEERAARNLVIAYWDLVNDGRDDDARLVKGDAVPLALTVCMRRLSGVFS